MPPKPRRYTDDEMHWALCHAMAHWCRRFRTELEPSMCAHVALKWASERMVVRDGRDDLNSVVGILTGDVRNDVVKLVKFYLRRLP